MLAVRDFVLWKPLNESIQTGLGAFYPQIHFFRDFFSQPPNFEGQNILNFGSREIGSCQLIHWFKRMLFRWFSEFSQVSLYQGVPKMEGSKLMTFRGPVTMGVGV